VLDLLQNLISQSDWIGPFLIRVSLCALMILMARRLVANRWGAQIRRLIWIILIVRCLMPWTQPIQYHPAGLLEFNRNQVVSIAPNPGSKPIDIHTEQSQTVQPDTYTAPDQAVQPSIVSPALEPVSKHSFQYSAGVLAGLWILGVFAVLIMTQYHYQRMMRRATADTVPVPPWIQEIFLSCLDQLKIRTCPALIISPHIASPCLAGAVRPRILLPSRLLEDTTECEMRHIFLHECIHHKQGDIWYTWLWTLTLALHWFNPLLWWAGRRLSQDCEAACDERVLAMLEPDKRTSYGQSLLALAKRLCPTETTQPGFNCIVERTSKFERRLTMIKYYHKRHVPMAGKLVLILFSVLVLTSYAGPAKTPITSEKAELMGRVEDFFLHNGRYVSSRKSLEWGPVNINHQGNRTIRYKYEAQFLGQERKTNNQVFVFDAQGYYLGHETLETTSAMQPLVDNFVTVDMDGGPTWQEAIALTNDTWFVGNFAGRNDERWYQQEVFAEMTYRFFVDDSFGSGLYTADPEVELFEQKVDESTRVISEDRHGLYGEPLEYCPEDSCTIYIRIISDNPGSTSFALGFTKLPGELPGMGGESDSDAYEEPKDDNPRISGSVGFLFEDNYLDYESISTPTEFSNKDFKLTSLGLAADGAFLYIKLVFDSPIESTVVGVRLAGESNMNEFSPYGTEIGENLLIIQLETEQVLTYPNSICVEIGDDRSVLIEKEIVDDFLK